MTPDPPPSPADASVRLARAPEADAIAEVQTRALAAYGDTVPAAVRDVDRGAAASAWREAVVRPPTARHRVLVALAGPTVLGFAATGPNEDPDAQGGADGEVLAFVVDPDRTGEGHGSRLLAACADTLRADGFRRARTWLLGQDDALHQFLASAGWAADGAVRELEVPADDPATGPLALRQVRLHTDLTET